MNSSLTAYWKGSIIKTEIPHQTVRITPLVNFASTSARLKIDTKMKTGKSKTKSPKYKVHKEKKLKRKHSVGFEGTHSPKEKKRKRNKMEAEYEPIEMSNGLTAKRVAGPYTGGLGSKGIKTKAAFTFDISSIDTSSSPNHFEVPLTDEEEMRRKRRMARFSLDSATGSTASGGSTDKKKKKKKKQTIELAIDGALSASRSSGASTDPKKESKKRKKTKNGQHDFVGTCQNLEKPYLRLTTFPKAQDVRPLSVLKRSIVHIKKRYIETEDFEWANEQLKSVRQDLTVQGLRNDFVLEVYETHARILLEHGDLNEFNQCQSMIKSLTMGLSSGAQDQDSEIGCIDPNECHGDNEIEGENPLLKQSKDCADEFAAYRLLYALVQKDFGEMTKELLNAHAVTKSAGTRDVKEDKRRQRTTNCEHAVLVAKAVIHNDYHTFFRLYESALNLSAYLMDFLVQRVRQGAYERIVASYRPTVSVEFFREALFFHDLKETRQFLEQSGAVFVNEGSGGGPPFWVDCKTSR